MKDTAKTTHGVILLVAVMVAVMLAPFACAWPDGLERVAEDHGFIDRAATLFPAPVPDYVMPGLADKMGTAAAGALGVMVTFAVVWGFAHLMAGPTRCR